MLDPNLLIHFSTIRTRLGRRRVSHAKSSRQRLLLGLATWITTKVDFDSERSKHSYVDLVCLIQSTV